MPVGVFQVKVMEVVPTLVERGEVGAYALRWVTGAVGR
jgi:hypothetical protein